MRFLAARKSRSVNAPSSACAGSHNRSRLRGLARARASGTGAPARSAAGE